MLRALKHGDLVKHGDEFNHGPMYYCAKCNGTHTREYKGCDGLREMPVNGTFSWERPPVPTGYVPRVHRSGFLRVDESTKIKGDPLPPLADPIAQAVDDYLLMERKARAWDALLRVTNDTILLATMNAMLHPAQKDV